MIVIVTLKMLSLLCRRQYSKINRLSLSSCRLFSNDNLINNNDSDYVKKLLSDWPRDHRQRINDMIRLIGE